MGASWSPATRTTFPSVPPSPFKNNLQLSTTTALTVTQQLIKAGMGPARLVAAYGEYEPATPSVNETSRQENRRIEIVSSRTSPSCPPSRVKKTRPRCVAGRPRDEKSVDP